MNTIPLCSGTAFFLKAEQTLSVVDPYGEQVANLVLFCEEDVRERLSSWRTFDYASTLRLTTSHLLYSDRSRPLARIAAESVGTHDFLLTPRSPDTWRIFTATHPTTVRDVYATVRTR
jgi:uncharacterized protein YcgI (DUF1989 family)